MDSASSPQIIRFLSVLKFLDLDFETFSVRVMRVYYLPFSSVGWFIILVFTTSAGVPIVAATRPAHALWIRNQNYYLFPSVKRNKRKGKSYLDNTWVRWLSGIPTLLIIERFAVSYVVKSPKFTRDALNTFGTDPFHNPRIPPVFKIFWKAS